MCFILKHIWRTSSVCNEDKLSYQYLYVHFSNELESASMSLILFICPEMIVVSIQFSNLKMKAGVLCIFVLMHFGVYVF